MKWSTIVVLIITLCGICFAAGAVTDRVMNSDRLQTLGRDKAIQDVNSLLASQWYKVRFRTSDMGISFTFPASKKEIEMDREHDDKRGARQ